MQFKMTYSDNNCKEFDIIQNDEKIAYYVEHYNHPLDNTKLENTVYELYYDFDGEEYTCSIVADTLNEALEYAELV
jgi:hypothetical protein